MAPEAEPVTSQTGISAVFFVALAILLYWALLRFDKYAGEVSYKVYAPYQRVAQLEQLQPKDPAQKLAAQGKNLFGTYCSVCHGPTGAGSPTAPPLAGSEWVNAAGAGRMTRIVLQGLQGPVTVKGNAYNLPGMIAWGEQVLTKDEDLAAVLTYIRSNKDWGNTGHGVTPEFVAKIRKETAARGGTQWTAEELEKIPANE
jgi:mono/diheme cytochrome c family protein